MPKLFELTASKPYYHVEVDGSRVSKHFTEREAIERAQQEKFTNYNDDVTYVHEYEVQVGLTDAGITEAKAYGSDQPPVIVGTPGPVFVQGTPATYSLSQFVSDDGLSPVAYAIVGTLPSGVSINASSGILTYNGSGAVATTSVAFTVSDSVGQATSPYFFVAIQEVSGDIIIFEDFTTAPLDNDQAPFYDDGCDYDQGVMPVTGSPCLRYAWAEGDVGTNGLITWRANFLEDNVYQQYWPQAEFEIEFDFATTPNFADVSSGTSGPHLIYLHTNLDGLYGDNTTIYIEPDFDGQFWVDLNKSDEPATWQTLRPTVTSNVYDGQVHHIKFYMKENTAPGQSDGIIRVWVDDVLTIDRSGLEILILDDQHVQNISFGPYIVGGVNNATGEVAMFLDNLVVRSLTPATEVVSPGSVQFASSTYTVSENAGTLQTTLTRSNGGDGQISVHVATSAGTATEGVDYTTVDSVVVFEDNEFSKTVTVTLTDDVSVEGNETFSLVLSSPTGGASIGTTDTTIITITDDDGEASALTVDNPVINFTRSNLTFTVYVDQVSGSETPFTYTTTQLGTASDHMIAGTHYTTTSGSSVIPAGARGTQIHVPISMSEPSNLMRLRFTVTDDNSNVSFGVGGVTAVINEQDFDYPYGAVTKKSIYRPVPTSQYGTNYSEANLVPKSGRTTIDPTTSAVGLNSMYSNNLITAADWNASEGKLGQPIVGMDTLNNLNCGSVTDGEEYYFMWYMKLGSEWRWNYNDPTSTQGNNTCKFGRFTAGNTGYSTPYFRHTGFSWQRNWPEGVQNYITIGFECEPELGNVYGSDLVADLGTPVTDWRQYVFYQKRETSKGAGDGIGRLVIDGQIVWEDSAAEWTTDEPIEAPDTEGVRITNMCWPGFIQNQISRQTVNFPLGDGGTYTGGDMWFDGYVATKGIWPSSKYLRPW